MDTNSSIPLLAGMSLEEYFTAKEREANRKAQLPGVILMILFIVLGCAGNTLVMIIYGRGFRRGPFRVAMLLVTGLDLISCLFLIPLDIVVSYGYPGDILCIVRHYLGGFTIAGSALALVQLAVIRFRKVCHPYEWQMTNARTKLWTLIIIIFSAIVTSPFAVLKGRQTKLRSLPASFIQGTADSLGNIQSHTTTAAAVGINSSDTVVNEDQGVSAGNSLTDNTTVSQRGDSVAVGYECTIKDEWIGSAFPTVMDGLLMFAFIATGLSIIILYAWIVREAWLLRTRPNYKFQWSGEGSGRPRLFRMFSLDENSDEDETATPRYTVTPTDVDETATPHRYTNRASSPEPAVDCVSKDGGTWEGHQVPYTALSDLSEAGDDRSLEIAITPTSASLQAEADSSSPDVLLSDLGDSTKSERQKATGKGKLSMIFNRSTAMLVVISAIYILGHIISITAAYFKLKDPRAYLEMSHARRTVILFFLRMFYINCAANPVVYSFWDPGFRSRCCALFKRK